MIEPRGSIGRAIASNRNDVEKSEMSEDQIAAGSRRTSEEAIAQSHSQQGSGGLICCVGVSILDQRRWRMKKAMMLAAAFCWVSQSAWANYACTGTTTSVAMDSGGGVNISNSSGLEFVWLCSVNTPSNGVSVEACKAMYAMFLSSKLSGAQVTLWFSDGLSCTTHAAWAALPSGNYNGGGWYWGPALAN